MINNSFLYLSPIYLVSILIVFILSKKWVHDKILLASLISNVFCLLAFSMGNVTLAITTILTSNTTLTLYSMFFRRKR